MSHGVMCLDLSRVRFPSQLRLASLPLQLRSVICAAWLFDLGYQEGEK